VTPVERDTVIRTLVGEAMGEGEAGQAAVAFVIKTRATYPGKTWWGDTIWDVCHRPLQFSCWNDGAPTLPRMCSLSPYSSTYEALGFSEGGGGASARRPHRRARVLQNWAGRLVRLLRLKLRRPRLNRQLIVALAPYGVRETFELAAECRRARQFARLQQVRRRRYGAGVGDGDRLRVAGAAARQECCS
jgi:hypothetical protein